MIIIPKEKTPKWVIKNNYPINLDQYYTKIEIAEDCMLDFNRAMQKIGLDVSRHVFIEPSAGDGAFFDLLPSNKIGMDLHTTRKDILTMNFFDFTPHEDKKYIAIGNPPFGVRSWMALAFINQCATFCDAVGFILPMYFASNGKGSAKNRVRNMDLIFSKELPPDIFSNPQGEQLSINTVFQVWTKNGLAKSSDEFNIPVQKIKQYIDVYTVCTAPARRCGLKKLYANEYDYFYRAHTIIPLK